FEAARRRLASEIVHWGYVPDRDAYWRWLQQADILPVTSRHDFFGRSVVEAMAAGVLPLLPRRLAYPEHLPESWQATCLYGDEDELKLRLGQWLEHGWPAPQQHLRQAVRRYDWALLCPIYDERLAHMRGEN
ncbi:MAG: glycosyltransferase, partial [Bacteroidetes bacterium]